MRPPADAAEPQPPLSRLVADLAAHGATLRRAWPRGGGHLLLDLVLADGTTAAGQSYADPASAARVAEKTAARAGSGDVTLLDGTGVVVQRRGADRRLPALSALAGRDDAVLVAHRPERRGVVRLRGDRTPTVYAKVVGPERLRPLAAATAAVAAALARAARRPDDPDVRVPRVVHEDAAAGILTTAELPGPTLHELLTTPGAEPAVRAAGRATGAALAQLHRAPVPAVSRAHRPLDELEATRGWVAAAAAAGALPDGVAPVVTALLRDLEGALAGPAGPPALVHRDLHDKQLVVGGRAAPFLGVLDADLAAVGEPALDLANLLVHLELRALQGGTPPATARACAQAVLDGYAPDDAVTRRLPAYDLAARLRLVGVYAFRPTSAGAALRLVADHRSQCPAPAFGTTRP